MSVLVTIPQAWVLNMPGAEGVSGHGSYGWSWQEAAVKSCGLRPVLLCNCAAPAAGANTAETFRYMVPQSETSWVFSVSNELESAMHYACGDRQYKGIQSGKAKRDKQARSGK